MLATEKSNRHGMKNWMRAVQRRVSSLRSGRMAMDGAAALYSCSPSARGDFYAVTPYKDRSFYNAGDESIRYTA